MSADIPDPRYKLSDPGLQPSPLSQHTHPLPPRLFPMEEAVYITQAPIYNGKGLGGAQRAVLQGESQLNLNVHVCCNSEHCIRLES